ncbi:MAG: energy transducer TonB [Terriglobales bacterium]
MKTRIGLLCAVLLCAVDARSELGVNCGERTNLFRNESGVVWFTPEQLDKMATRRIEPAVPRNALPSHYDGYVTFKILVNTNGEVGCIWASTGNPIFVRAVNEALQYWRYKPMLMDGRPVEYVGVVRFHVHAD